MERVILAKSAGFCFGVRRAVELAQKVAESGEPYVMLGPVIHNDHVIEQLEEKGVACVSSVEEVPPGYGVIIRSHGEGKAVYDALAARGCQIADATCVNVSRIHEIVKDASDRGRQVIIIGSPEHPEVKAIAGWGERAKIFRNEEELTRFLVEKEENQQKPVTLVSQTTSTNRIWTPCREKVKKLCTNAEIFDTICNATCMRQSEAQSLAEQCGAMIVIGDRKSSNTTRLAELCRAHCPLVFHISRAEELDRSMVSGVASVGITAGASTPGWIIKEVKDKMSDETNNVMEIEESFAEMLENSIKTLNTGDKVTGVVTGITATEVNVDLGTKHAGYIPISELSDDPSVKPEDVVKVGDEIETYVMRVNDVEGVATLSKKRLDTVKNWDTIEAAVEEKTIMEGTVTEDNKGGIVVNVKGIRVFVPASQTGMPRGADLSEMIKQRVKLRITEVNRSRRRVVGSVRAVQAEERAAKAAEVWENIEEGKKYEGTVKSLTSYGAFVDIGGVDGMVHVSELSWSRIKNPAEVVSVGDHVSVYVISFDPEKKKISLGMKDRSQDPWEKFTSTYEVGSVASVRVVKLMTFGAFAEVVPGVDGLIHISQIADHRIEKPGDVLEEGQVVDVKITDIDYERKKVSLSIRALLNDACAEEGEQEEDDAGYEE
ncbi:MAG: bifunctional 4-hydroxy-3-methylbut-2-enyl diphosphate reductase/30S ribosomal protein S1 [Evtepia sp.]|uniref:bifunctional 4-hydroxy-3-methylbut-2-enyl diphosphate reductase/30S ribosomal protein S1 n=1 Tax=Evtepia sp. TaxID=2773933 RepID=UPI002A750FA8|nr:bifunctional 4-hydroxy-3-methylbut-2-enyl diphosphate reductase/30S ribosomal protein S1 [Evtepia sp.]MDY3014530.1 bifunctional 4-hydroxy-3-methylbut-2-enyl diphosphate reductase/30S ribosomal protein S1 [Evtepia sp.]